MTFLLAVKQLIDFSLFMFSSVLTLNVPYAQTLTIESLEEFVQPAQLGMKFIMKDVDQSAETGLRMEQKYAMTGIRLTGMDALQAVFKNQTSNVQDFQAIVSLFVETESKYLLKNVMIITWIRMMAVILHAILNMASIGIQHQIQFTKFAEMG